MAVELGLVICELLTFILTTSADSKNLRVLHGVQTSNPHLVQIDVHDPSDVVSCSGSILNNQWIITAAHCVDTNYIIDITVRFNNDYIFKKDVSHYVVHPYYQGVNNKHDIALLKTRDPMVFNGNISPVSLSRRLPMPGEVAKVAGFGLPDLKPEEGGVVVGYCNGTTLCTHSRRNEAKPEEGDSGGPLMSSDGELIGVDSAKATLTSYGRWGELNTYSLDFYADIPSNIDWIESVIQN